VRAVTARSENPYELGIGKALVFLVLICCVLVVGIQLISDQTGGYLGSIGIGADATEEPQHMDKPRRIALYVRVSTDGQTTENQRRELQAIAERHGWQVVEVFKDQGVSGAKSRDQRPAMRRLMQGVARRDFDMVAAWSVDRLGRSLQDLIGLLGELHAKRVDLYLHQQGLDTSTPAGKAMFQMMGVFAEFERAMIQERVKAGLRRAVASGKTLGRPKVAEKIEARVRALRKDGVSMQRIAKTIGIGKGTVLRILG
jgi:DNA invertase Pin-like site-specific DNA recombinase